MSRLLNQSAIIVGGADSVGHGIATKFVREGARVAIIDAADPPKDTTAEPALISIKAKIESKSDARIAVEQAVARLGGVHILVNNTLPACEMVPLEDKSEQAVIDAMKAIQTAFWSMQAVFPHLKKQRWGRIVNIGSRYGQTMNVFNGDHNTAGWALRGLTRTAAAEWARFGIHSNLLEIAPDTEDFKKYRNQNPEVIDMLLGQVALGRRGDVVEDIGAAAVFAACDESNWINGQVFYADGGQHIAVPAFIPAVHMGFSYAENP